MYEIKAKGPRFENEEFIRLQAEKIKNLASLRGEKKYRKATVVFFYTDDFNYVAHWDENPIEMNNFLAQFGEKLIAIVEIALNEEAEGELFFNSPFFEEIEKEGIKTEKRIKKSHARALKRYPLIREAIFERKITKQIKKVNLKRVPAFNRIGDYEKRNVKTILFGLQWLEHGGAEKMAVANIKAACEAGYNVIVVTHRTGIPTYLGSILESTDQVYMLPSLLPRRLELEAIQHIIKTHEVDCIHLHHNAFIYWNLPGLKYQFPHLKIIDSTHIIEYDQGGYVAASGRFGEYIDAHHVISKQIISNLRDNFEIPRAKMHLGYLYNEDKINTQVPGELHEKFDDIQSQCNILFVGRSVRQKRPHLVPLIAKKLIKSCRTTQFTFNFVGEGPYLEVVKHWVKKYKLENQFTFHPADSDVETLMEDSHFLLIPSENEGLTLVAYEAAEKNTICLSSDVGSQKEIIADEALTPRNAKETVLGMTKIICEAIKEKSFLEQLMQSQADKVNALYASPHWKEVVLSLYKK